MDDGRALVEPVPYNGSADIVGPAAADAYFEVPRGTERLERGDTVRFFEVKRQ
jgi:molybdopterin biosynthesis enzyme